MHLPCYARAVTGHPAPLPLAAVEQSLGELYVAAEGAGLRDEHRKKAAEIAPLLEEIRRAVVTTQARRRGIVLVDAAAGLAYVGLLAARLVLAPAGVKARIVAIDREAARADTARLAALRLGISVEVEVRVGDLAEPALWPRAPSLVVALHACGKASDAIVDSTIACEAARLLLVPCCYPDTELGARLARGTVGIPRHAAVRRRFAQAVVDAERTLRLEAAGYATEVVELVSPSVTPHNLLWRSRRVAEPRRMAEAAARLADLRATFGLSA